MKPLLLMTMGFTYSQLILGATLRHTGNQFIAVSHIVNGFFILIHSGLVMARVLNHYEGDKQLVYPAVFLGFLTLLQMAFGIGAFIYTIALHEAVQISSARVFFVTVHQTLGALLLATIAFLTLRIYRKAAIK
ncbi:MAG: hypothetical protein A3C35_05230 [Omnitrophica bacterium RIFCSPHIGHO2_02_FULL_46_11]|nr:MAG: hypothetical protein A3C35_05230 [Omnitrophica bacterium RIFCSPHIGHO2_02_FULL_46_11]